jgi:hypothetical protein
MLTFILAVVLGIVLVDYLVFRADVRRQEQQWRALFIAQELKLGRRKSLAE